MMVGVIVEHRALKSIWADYAWMPVGVLSGAPAAEPWTVLDESPELTRYYAGEAELEFFSSETAYYRDNLRSEAPRLWVALTESDNPPGIALKTVTADPAEGEALTEPGADIIETVPMPAEIQARLAAFVEAHHVEREFFKRKRGPTVPEPGGHA
jgi:hypothetical protein